MQHLNNFMSYTFISGEPRVADHVYLLNRVHYSGSVKFSLSYFKRLMLGTVLYVYCLVFKETEISKVIS
jgi:hypothetical protein